jgi:phospholipase/carboxylesterase
MAEFPEFAPDRRRAIRALGIGLVALGAAPVAARLGAAEQSSREELGRLTSRPGTPTEPVAPGLHALGLDRRRDGVLYLPPQYRKETPLPLVLLLHGAGGSGSRAVQRFKGYADELGMAFVAPDSRGVSWDREDRLTKDVAFIDAALAVAYRRINVNADRLRIGGFSDGGSYSLSVGLTNGDLFGRILALSPGFMDPARLRGKPEIYVTHGTRDDILPIDRTSRKIVPALKQAGYAVEYHEFDGRHETPPEICRPGFEWLLSG